jgi:transcriptional regulator with XRE-family HTH domain
MDITTSTISPDWYSMSDPAILAELCLALKQLRLQQNLTQGQLAEKAGLSRSAISKIELGKVSVSLLTVIQVLRALQQFHILNTWKVAATISPIAMAKVTAKGRLRASGKVSRKTREGSEW